MYYINVVTSTDVWLRTTVLQTNYFKIDQVKIICKMMFYKWSFHIAIWVPCLYFEQFEQQLKWSKYKLFLTQKSAKPFQ